MKTLRMATAALIALAALAGGTLYAQAPVGIPGGAPQLPPAYSPYLNLLRNGNPAYVNYYGLVRPEQDWRSQVYGLQAGVATNSAAISAVDAATGLPLTGHSTTFMNTSHYFLNRGGQGTPGTASTNVGQPVTRSVGQPAATAPGH